MQPDHEGQPTRAPRRWGRWIGFSILGLMVLLIAGHAFWGWWQDKKLQEEIAALRAKGEPMLIEELGNSPVPDADNMVILLREGARSIDKESHIWQEMDQMELGLPLSDKEMEAVGRLIKENPTVLQKLREARARKGVDWKLDRGRSIFLTEIPDLNEQRLLGRLGAAAILLEHQKGNDREAVALARDLLAQSDAVQQMPAGLIAYLVGRGIGAMACERVCEIVPDLRVGNNEGEVAPEEVKRLIDALLDEKSLKEGQQRAMRVERAAQVQAVHSLRNIQPGPTSGETAGMSATEYVMRPLFLKDGRIMLGHTTAMMQEATQAADWPDFRQRVKEEVNRIMGLRQNPGHMMLAMVTPAYERMIEHGFRSMAERRLAATALAARLFFVEQGRWPRNLDELAPRYLPAVSGDPMASGKKLGYAADDHRPRIYSVGENGSDEGGSDAALKKTFGGGRWMQADAIVDLTKRPRKKEGE